MTELSHFNLLAISKTVTYSDFELLIKNIYYKIYLEIIK